MGTRGQPSAGGWSTGGAPWSARRGCTAHGFSGPQRNGQCSDQAARHQPAQGVLLQRRNQPTPLSTTQNRGQTYEKGHAQSLDHTREDIQRTHSAHTVHTQCARSARTTHTRHTHTAHTQYIHSARTAHTYSAQIAHPLYTHTAHTRHFSARRGRDEPVAAQQGVRPNTPGSAAWTVCPWVCRTRLARSCRQSALQEAALGTRPGGEGIDHHHQRHQEQGLCQVPTGGTPAEMAGRGMH